MKLDSKMETDRQKKKNYMTADHTSRPDKVLFFPTAHFLFFNLSLHTLHTFGFAQPHKANPSQNQKSAISQRFNKY